MATATLRIPHGHHFDKHQLKRLVSGVAWGVLSIFVLGILALAIYTRTGAGHLTPVLSGSMRPGIHEGDVVVTHKVAVSSLHKGDIIVFTPPGYQVAKVHRIVSLEPMRGGAAIIQTKGDYNKIVDPWGKIIIKGDTYKVSAVIPKIGWLVNGGLRWIITGFTLLGGLIVGRWTWEYIRSPEKAPGDSADQGGQQSKAKGVKG